MLKPSQRNNLVFLCDEPENSLHPKWQLDFPSMFKRVVEDIYKLKGCHFIFATHSPLIVMRSANLHNSCVVKLYREKDDNNRFKGEIIDHLNRYSVVKLLLDEFDFNYYTESERKQIKEDLFKRIDWNIETSYSNLLSEVRHTLDIRDAIREMYEGIFDQKNEIH